MHPLFRGLLTIVRGTLAELHGAKAVGQPRDLSGNTAQSPQFLVGRLALVVLVQDVGVLEGVLLGNIGRICALLVRYAIGRGRGRRGPLDTFCDRCTPGSA